MELTLICVVGVVAIVLVAHLSERIGVAAPLALVVVGIGLSFMPGLPEIDVEPEWILTGVLPPLLYAAAVSMPTIDFRRNFRAISGLAVLLVVVTTLCSGVMFNALMSGLGLAAAFALGAVISPTDAVAATSVGKRLGLPSRLVTILEGEGLVNDASSLVLLGSAVTAITATVHIWEVGRDFVYAVVLAIAIGLVAGYVSIRVRALLKDPVLNTAMSFVVPFVAFVPAEEFGASGVLAAVVAGLVTGHESPRYLRAHERLAEEVNWRTVAFLLESGLFLLMGLQVKTLIDDAGSGTARAVWIGLLASLLVVVLRVAFVGPMVAMMRRDTRRAVVMKPVLDKMQDRFEAWGPEDERYSERRKEQATKRITRRKADVGFYISESFGWRGGVVLAWAGMRGAITVAAAQSLPGDTPYRSELLLIAFVVAATTLLVQGITLPTVIRTVKIPGDDAEADRAEYGDLLVELGGKVELLLDDPDVTGPYPAKIVEKVREDTVFRGVPSNDNGDDENEDPPPSDVDPRKQYLELMLTVMATERVELLAARAEGAYSSRTLTRAQHSLDEAEGRLQQFTGLDDD